MKHSTRWFRPKDQRSSCLTSLSRAFSTSMSGQQSLLKVQLRKTWILVRLSKTFSASAPSYWTSYRCARTSWSTKYTSPRSSIPCAPGSQVCMQALYRLCSAPSSPIISLLSSSRPSSAEMLLSSRMASSTLWGKSARSSTKFSSSLNWLRVKMSPTRSLRKSVKLYSPSKRVVLSRGKSRIKKLFSSPFSWLLTNTWSSWSIVLRL